MANYPTKKDLQEWTPIAVLIFRSTMPPINTPYPRIYIATAKTFPEMRAGLLKQTGCLLEEEPETSIGEYIHGDSGNAILIRQNLIPDKDPENYCYILWHELGHFYAINSERVNLHHYNNPGLVDDSHILEFNALDEPVLGLSDERLKQEGYWFWQEFIAESICKYVSYKHRSADKNNYHPELLDWDPKNWGGIVDKLMGLLDDTFGYYPSTIDHYSLAHYFANLLVDDFILLYRKAAEEGKLKVYDNNTTPPSIVYPDEPIEPTCISDIDEEELQKPLWKLKELLEEQMQKEEFWIIDEYFLLQIGTCLGELLFEKVVLMSQHWMD